MTIEAKLDRTNTLLEQLLEKFAHIGRATDAPVAPPKQAAKPAEKPAAPSGPLSYDKDIKPIALALAKKNREALTRIWGELGVKIGTELKPEQLPEAKRLIEEASK